MTEAQDTAWAEVETAMLADADDDVQSTDLGLIVNGSVFAFRAEGGDLVVDLPAGRASDLVERGVGRAHEAELRPKGAWTLIDDPEDWTELASEAHAFVGEPEVGRDS